MSAAPPARSPHAARTRTLLLSAVSLVAALLVGACGSAQDGDPEARASRIQPVAKVVVKVQKTAPGSRSGEQVYKGICAGCHDAAAMGSPKTGDKAAWAPRLAQGFDTLTRHAIEGIGQMPPRGGGADLADTEVRRAVAFIANKAGANFTEPPVQQ